MPKPIFKSLMRFSLASPRFEYRSRVFIHAIAGDGVIAIGRLVLKQILFPRTSHDDQSERLVGLVHAMDRLGDFSVAKRLPLASGIVAIAA